MVYGSRERIGLSAEFFLQAQSELILRRERDAVLSLFIGNRGLLTTGNFLPNVTIDTIPPAKSP